MAQATRPYQIVVWGASGFTGQLVCKHIAKEYQGRITWAIAGRDQRKLEQVRAELAKINSTCKDVPILVADALNGEAVGKVLSQTKVVIAMAGPFAKYGDKVVEQSIEQGTHYCDITGELPWVKRMLLKHNEKAKEKGVKIVHCCGYDSIPSDLGTFMMVDYIKKEMKKNTAHVYELLGAGKGGFSGGTIASGKEMVAKESWSELADVNSNAYYLAGLVGGKGTDKPAPRAPAFIEVADTWAGPFVMEGVNARVVHLSNALAKERYGTDFKYTEMVKTGSGWVGWAAANALSAVMATIGIVFVLPPLRALSSWVLPAPGQGPSLEAQETGYWSHLVYGVTEEAPGVKPTVVQGLCGDRRDPGYWSTSRMVLEAGLCLALDSEKLEEGGYARSGFLTAATAMGMVLIERLRAAGQTWEVPTKRTSVLEK